MNSTTEERIEIRAGNSLILNVPFTTEGLELGRAMLKLLEPTPFFPPKSSPKQRIKYKEWEAVANTEKGFVIYKEVLSRMLEEYKDGVVPATEIFSQIIREMYGEHLKEDSIATYTSLYKRYIKENKLAIKHQGNKIKKPKTKDLLPMDKVIEIWNLLPSEFTNKQVKALVPAHIMQTAPRIDTTNYILKQFLDNPAFECEETSPGIFSKKVNGDGE